MTLPAAPDSPPSSSRAATTVAAVAATGALACGVCCVLPFALPAAMLALSGGVLAWFASLMPALSLVAMAAVVGGWGRVLFQARKSGKRTAWSTWRTMSIATALLILAFAWPFFEGALIALIKNG